MNMTKHCILAAVALTAMSGTAHAAISLVDVEPGSAVYEGPVPIYDFDVNTPPTTDGVVKTGSSANGAQPLGSTGNYYSVGPSTNSPGEVDLSGFAGPIGQISFIWGSVDTYNTLSFLDSMGGVLASFTGSDIISSDFGNQVLPGSNPVVFFGFTGSDAPNVAGMRLSSTQEAFEIDNIAVEAAVPEPGTWLMLLLGFGIVGAMMRRGRKGPQEVRVRYAF
ncbi:PEPxxWA-CTERM sorting domain-containing protein [Altererythrobacter aurantiacus]|uniref:PEPxxWA-CTERM sorting domain-containing protein n=1 Tax=Parapontixanthobacter aurantiacus TaxID=1463599 RepID=A0A844ZEB2_9SPHN|nr:PEPxxWA-CTERM sorting domain-containing protein [Parapontixanthobacter aurantiacus]MXO86118.1 PEPxxWA-CTERM sorting domain-containing protein [Parapontixanthobacter aurantiacus]